MNEQSLVVCSHISKQFGSLKALDDFSLTLGGGHIIGLLGPNGSGKTTLIKLLNGLLKPTSGTVTIGGAPIGEYTHTVTAYLPDKMYLPDWMKTSDLIDFFSDFYADFDRTKAFDMLRSLDIAPDTHLKTMSKGTKEKVQLIVTMARKARLYLLDEPIGGVDPAARDYILNTILTNYSEDASVIISTHLISDIERVLDEVVFLKKGLLFRHDTVDNIRETERKSVDQLFREVFATC